MDHDVIGEPLLDRCKLCIESILQAPDLHSVASASLAIFTQMRQGARDIRQAKMALEAQQRRRQEVARCCPDANIEYIHTRTVRPKPLILIEAPSSAYRRGMLALGKQPPEEEETSCDFTPSHTSFTVVLTYMLVACTCAC